MSDSSLGHTGSLILFLIFGFLNFNFLKWKPHPLSQDRKAQRQLERGLELEEVQGVEGDRMHYLPLPFLLPTPTSPLLFPSP